MSIAVNSLNLWMSEKIDLKKKDWHVNCSKQSKLMNVRKDWSKKKTDMSIAFNSLKSRLSEQTDLKN